MIKISSQTIRILWVSALLYFTGTHTMDTAIAWYYSISGFVLVSGFLLWRFAPELWNLPQPEETQKMLDELDRNTVYDKIVRYLIATVEFLCLVKGGYIFALSVCAFGFLWSMFYTPVAPTRE